MNKYDVANLKLIILWIITMGLFIYTGDNTFSAASFVFLGLQPIVDILENKNLSH